VSSAQGIDVSSWQPVLQSVAGLDFVFVKATEGTSWVDPNFAANWEFLAGQPVVRGAYHFFHPSQPADRQAALFMSVVAGHGLRRGDMLAGDFEVAEGTRPGRPARQFLDDVTAAAEAITGARHCPVLCYSYLDFLQNLGPCTSYPLWLAAYSSTPPPSAAPWQDWTIWQWSGGGGPHGADQDAFNGSPSAFTAWITAYAGSQPAPPVPDWTEKLVKELPALQQGTTGEDVRTLQACLYARRQVIQVDGVFGPQTKSILMRFQSSRGLASDGIAGPETWPRLLNR
jgi:GH25 family lysozyme M1 (1,4-beta-N-acetylmuramidase)